VSEEGKQQINKPVAIIQLLCTAFLSVNQTDCYMLWEV